MKSASITDFCENFLFIIREWALLCDGLLWFMWIEFQASNDANKIQHNLLIIYKTLTFALQMYHS